MDAFEDARAKLSPTFAIKEQTEKEFARAALFAPGGASAEILARIEALSGDSPGHLVGSSFTLADIW